MAAACVIGRHGLIGSALARKLGEVTPFPTPETRVLYHFGSYTHTEFERNPEMQMKTAFESFTTLLPYCRERGILFVYPSSALVYEGETQFARFKRTLEQLVACYEVRSIGLRIFPVYGPGESRTVISQWCRQMRRGERPVVYGDGEQARDFIYVDDAADQIIAKADSGSPGYSIADIGTGRLTKFNDIVAAINAELQTELAPQYMPAPKGYSHGIAAKRRTPTISVREGIGRILWSPEASQWSSRRAETLIPA